MITSTNNTATVSKLLAIGLLLATLLAPVPADTAVTSGKAFAWGDNYYGQLGIGNTGTDSDVPVAVKNFDGGLSFTLAATQ